MRHPELVSGSTWFPHYCGNKDATTTQKTNNPTNMQLYNISRQTIKQ